MSDNELTIQLLSIQNQIANCGEHWIVRNTLRQKAASLAAEFVDPDYQEPAHPPLRSGKVMSEERPVPGCPF